MCSGWRSGALHGLYLRGGEAGRPESGRSARSFTKNAVSRSLGMLAAHAAGHIDQIWQTRRIHSV
ncbi:MAG TPA: hypothetical protein VK191_12435 [Symbiobacteriaceae bacterium]|nr:hypothetical protein [Symbiobacteriaceae bacterium]